MSLTDEDDWLFEDREMHSPKLVYMAHARKWGFNHINFSSVYGLKRGKRQVRLSTGNWQVITLWLNTCRDAESSPRSQAEEAKDQVSLWAKYLEDLCW